MITEFHPKIQNFDCWNTDSNTIVRVLCVMLISIHRETIVFKYVEDVSVRYTLSYI